MKAQPWWPRRYSQPVGLVNRSEVIVAHQVRRQVGRHHDGADEVHVRAPGGKGNADIERCNHQRIDADIVGAARSRVRVCRILQHTNWSVRAIQVR